MSTLVLMLTLVAAPEEQQAHRHWAFAPSTRPALPAVQDRAWPRSPIDNFVLVKLEEKGLTPSPIADRQTLIRRAYYDLIGLPPRHDEIESFVHDESPDAFMRLVDRLLASPHYGERWGRHWLDVARYAETKDIVLVYGADAIRPYAYTYRDYVIRALNADLPYDQFIHQQLAADKLAPQLELWQLAAMGFLTLGRLYDYNPPDIYDDYIDTVTRGLLGLSVSCARCHDHKYDPIPTEDYYSLYGVFASSESPIDLPLIDDDVRTAAATEFESQAAAKRDELRKHIDAQYEMITETARVRIGDYLMKIATEPPDPLETAVFYLSLSPDALRPSIIASWRQYLERNSRNDHAVFGPWHELMQLPKDALAGQSAQILLRWQQAPRGTSDGQLNPLVARALDSAILKSRADVAQLYGSLFKRVHEEWKKSREAPSGAAAESQPEEDAAPREQLETMLTSMDGPIYFPRGDTYLYMSRVERDKYHKLLGELDTMAVKAPAVPPRAMILADTAEPFEPRVFVRGNPTTPGRRVPRRFLRLLSGDNPQPFTDGSGRLDLARAITAADNPLTSRVLTNRVWMHHLGEPLVATPSDFGMRSSPPSHPALLDYLAWSFVHDHGWSLKRLHRQIMLTNAYQQDSRDRADGHQLDPENSLLWKANRRRLDLEAMRDTLLAVSNRLDARFFGRSVDIAGDPANRRRTIYGLVDRQNLPGLFRTFDFASPDQSAAQRPHTTVPQQALFAMNSPLVIEQAKALAARDEVACESSLESRVAALYRLILAREPEKGELELARRFIDTATNDNEQPASQLTPWEQYAQVLLLANELMFVD